MPINIKWDSTYKCNLHCEHCINGALLDDNSNDISCLEFERIIDDIQNNIKINSIHLLGGEPTVRKDFLEVCKVLENRQIFFGFNTNSLLLTDDLIRNLLSLKYLRNIVISLEGANATTNDEIRGKKVFDVLVKRLLQLSKMKERVKSSVSITINTVLTNQNYNQIEQLVDLALLLRVDQLNLLQIIEEGNAKGKKLGLSDNQFLSAIETIANVYPKVKNQLRITPRFARPLAKEYAMTVLSKDFPEVRQGCSAGINFAFMDNRGRLFPCNRLLGDKSVEKDNFSLAKNPFTFVWAQEQFDIPLKIMESDRYANLEPCKYCHYFKKSCFPCPAQIDEFDQIHECMLLNRCINNIKFNDIKLKDRFLYRVVRKHNDSFLFVNTGSGKHLLLNEEAAKFFQFLKDKESLQYSDIENYAIHNKANLSECNRFLNYLREQNYFSGTSH